MNVSPVSFGQVIAVSGKSKKIQHLRCEMANANNVARIDATNYYKNSYSTGLLGDAIRNNQLIDIYITKDDYNSYVEKKPNWRTIDEVACHLDKYYDLKKISTNVVKDILKGNI